MDVHEFNNVYIDVADTLMLLIGFFFALCMVLTFTALLFGVPLALVYACIKCLLGYYEQQEAAKIQLKPLRLKILENKSIKEVLNDTQPNKIREATAIHAYDELCLLIQKYLRPAKIKRVGSFGRGTHVGNDFDIDVVVSMPCNAYDFDFIGSYLDTRTIPQMPQTVLDWRTKLIYALTKEGIYPNTKCDDHMVKLNYLNIKFDVILTPDIDPSRLIPIAERIERNSQVYRMLSASIAEVRSKVYKYVTEDYKGMIRLAKFWSMRHKWEDPKSRPFSFFIETVMLKACDDCDSHTHHDILELFFEYMILQRYGKVIKVFGTNLPIKPTRYGYEHELHQFACESLCELRKLYKNNFLSKRTRLI
ncbi:1 TM domain-containing transmembrane protein [Acrasis kona]|uniref:1 TM domain-containing transmembrane protein n=1 Tax=Acrasis kona TaxID=1008807 RepID=A0AAW2Z9E8_9EUKA